MDYVSQMPQMEIIYFCQCPKYCQSLRKAQRKFKLYIKYNSLFLFHYHNNNLICLKRFIWETGLTDISIQSTINCYLFLRIKGSSPNFASDIKRNS